MQNRGYLVKSRRKQLQRANMRYRQRLSDIRPESSKGVSYVEQNRINQRAN